MTWPIKNPAYPGFMSPPGTAGPPGDDGLTILNGSGAPGAGLGSNGDFYIDTAASDIYGPKAGGAWGSPTSLLGANGADGIDGIDGLDGDAATIAVGDVAAVPYGTPPTVTNVGTPAAAIFDFELETGDEGDPGLDGDDAYVYIAYASDASGTDFTNTFDPDLDYIAILSTDTEIVTPVVGDFAGLWKNYKGATGAPGASGHTIQDETTPRTARANLNFTGAGVTATDNAGTDSTDVTIPGGGAGGLSLTDLKKYGLI
jgi:hypothetical protein